MAELKENLAKLDEIVPLFPGKVAAVAHSAEALEQTATALLAQFDQKKAEAQKLAEQVKQALTDLEGAGTDQEGAVRNARAYLALREELRSFDRFLWEFVGGEPRQNARRTLKDVPPHTPESDTLSRALQKRGFTFVGSTICYAYMQAAGLVNDHLVSCFRRVSLPPRC